MLLIAVLPWNVATAFDVAFPLPYLAFGTLGAGIYHPTFRAILEGQRAKARRHADQLEFYPLVRLRATYRF